VGLGVWRSRWASCRSHTSLREVIGANNEAIENEVRRERRGRGGEAPSRVERLLLVEYGL